MGDKKNIMMIIVVAVLLLGGGAFALTRSDDSTNESQSTTDSTSKAVEDFPINLELSNLQPLNSGAYEGWVVRDGAKHSFGRFNMDADGGINGDLALSDVVPANGDTIAISIEPENDTDPEPSATIVLAGEITGGVASLEFPVDVSEFAGKYIIATPTTSTTDDETAGVWFTTTGSDAGFDIPVAPAGWIYEGWTVFDGKPITTGQFSDPSKADLFSGFSGSGDFPAKPGEDFIHNLPNGLTGPIDLSDGTSVVVLSLEPFQDGVDPTGDGPAQVKPLTGMIPEGAADHTPYDLTLSKDSVPSGSAAL